MGFITLVEITKKKAEGRAKPGPRHFNVNLSERERKKGPPKRNSKGRPAKGRKWRDGDVLEINDSYTQEKK